MDLALTNVVNISVSATPAGVGAYNTSNLALFTREDPGVGFGSLGYKIYLEPSEVAKDFGSSSVTAAMANAVFSQQPNILAGSGYLVVIPMLDTPSAETLSAAIVRTAGLVQYFGILVAEMVTSVPMLAAAATLQPLDKLAFFVSRTAGDVAPGGLLDELRTGGFSHSRGLFYGGADDQSALVMSAAYAARALSTNFSGSNTTQTMHLKDLIGVQPDPMMTQTLLGQCTAAGADVYCSLQGVPKVFTSGGNQFFDDVYNLLWMVGALKVAGFNALAQSSTKLAQTEDGIGVLKGAYRAVLEAAVTNQFLAPGQWNSPTTFGNQEDFFRNLSERGYYVYSQPVAQQLQVDRAARKAPLIQIACKQAGAVHSSSVIVNINA
jgi:hypothetical protein